MKQVALALHLYSEAKGGLPRAGERSTGLSWHVYVLPYCEQTGLYDQFNQTTSSGLTSANIAVAMNKVPIFLCPSSRVDKMKTTPPNNVNTPEVLPNGDVSWTTHYYGILGPKGLNPQTGVDYELETAGGLNNHGGFAKQGLFMRDPNDGRRDEKGHQLGNIPDGNAYTFLLGEMSWDNQVTGTRYRSWARGCDDAPVCAGARNITSGINTPNINVFNDISMGSPHTPGGANFAFADGSVKYIGDRISINVYRSLASRDGGETNPEF
jgi:prepilin-type processing-associated H-X9-DG protein